MFESRSALESYRALPRITGGAALRLGEIAGTHLTQIGVYQGGAARLEAAVSPILTERLPESSVRAAVGADRLIMRIAPDQYWVAGGDHSLHERLREAIPPDAGCVTSLDGARTRLLVDGSAARDLLCRLLAIDLHPTAFPIGGFAQTGIHHIGGLLLRAGEDRYEFFALRTFAASTWEVLIDAARPFGYQIELPESKT
jgi:sarcosine oxidase subunit gamma